MPTPKPESILVIAEKPSVAKALAAWLSTTLKLPANSVGRSHIEVGKYNISWLFGHVLEHLEPHEYDDKYRRWVMADLPFFPPDFKLKPREEVDRKTRRKTGKPDPGTLAQIKALQALLKTSTQVIGLGDPDQEGQLLQDEFLIWSGNKLPVMRLWLSAIDDASIDKAWKAMKPNSAYAGYYWAARARSDADFLTGINLSRGCTLASQANGGNATLHVGRVQTPTLALVVQRELEIRAFKPVDYYTPYIDLATKPGFKASWAPDKEKDTRLDAEGRLLDRKAAETIAAACTAAGSALVKGVKSTKGKESPPLPFSLSSLQAHMSKRSGMGVADTLKHAQALYEKKVATYPRTDSEHLPESQHADASALLSNIGRAGIPSLGTALAKANGSLKSPAFNDKKVTAHHAIVPRPITFAQFSSLTSDEKAVWLEVTKRYLLQFFPAAEFLNTEIDLDCAKEPYRATGKVYTLRGWKDAFVTGATDEDEDDGAPGTGALPTVKKGDVLTLARAGFDSTRTKPPKRFTEGTLVAAMKGIHRYVSDPALKATLRDNVGIGTEATRANTIEELFNRTFFVLDKKDIRPSAVGEQLIGALPRQITAPDMTARWQQAMDDIRSTEEAGYTAFMKHQADWLRKTIEEVPDWFRGKSLTVAGKTAAKSGLTTKPTTHKCLTCGGALSHIKGKFGWFFGCQESACKAIFKDVEGKPVARAAPVTAAMTIDGVSSGAKCPKCAKGEMQVRTCGPHTKTPGKQFLSCSHFFAKGKDKCEHSIWPPR